MSPLAAMLLAHRHEGTAPPAIAIGDNGTIVIQPWVNGGLTLLARDDDAPEKLASQNIGDPNAIRQLRDTLTAILDVEAELKAARRPSVAAE